MKDLPLYNDFKKDKAGPNTGVVVWLTFWQVKPFKATVLLLCKRKCLFILAGSSGLYSVQSKHQKLWIYKFLLGETTVPFQFSQCVHPLDVQFWRSMCLLKCIIETNGSLHTLGLQSSGFNGGCIPSHYFETTENCFFRPHISTGDWHLRLIHKCVRKKV